MTLFETETMAELCAKQGQIADALAIYRRLVEAAPDAASRGRRLTRVAELEARTTAPTLTMTAVAPDPKPDEPSLRVERRGDRLTFTWALPPGTDSPALQIFLARRGADGVETETRTVPLDAPRGTTRLEVPALASVRAAVGRLEGGRFVPMARLPGGQPATL
jgi:hypothetical protein